MFYIMFNIYIFNLLKEPLAINSIMMYIHNGSFPIKSAFLPSFRIGKPNLSELCSDNMHFKLIDMKTKGM
jgi:hypothetical protein